MNAEQNDFKRLRAAQTAILKGTDEEAAPYLKWVFDDIFDEEKALEQTSFRMTMKRLGLDFEKFLNKLYENARVMHFLIG
ncbi:hypothetical protein CAP31_02640 [Sulfuriferula sp. AH1]|uniref:hypothetical protein n=1 Tax=Sulfuriferula sp. AH1 TaxID=1985873 RepID=UPI000B3B96D7|nr:hypothetical protein [Sulfuriferula sp. AH1]ARU30679.1 hypothetical protein CAP31_02640 [Sulfuriferula sp. AH1]